MSRTATPEDLVAAFEARMIPIAYIAREIIQSRDDRREAIRALTVGILSLSDDLDQLGEDVSKWMRAHYECGEEGGGETGGPLRSRGGAS